MQAWLDQVGYSEQPNTECLIQFNEHYVDRP